MDTQVRNPWTPEDTADPATCACCTPPQLLIPRDDVGVTGRYAVCVATGHWYENRGDGVFIGTAMPRQGEIMRAPAPRPPAAPPAGNQWAGGDALPVIVPGVRIDLSKESYA